MKKNSLILTPEKPNSSSSSRKMMQLFEEAQAMEIEDARKAGTIGYMARALVQATLPYREPKDVPVWGRRAGDISLMMQPGYYLADQEVTKGRRKVIQQVGVSIGYPYGSIPRLVVAWLSSEAVKTKSRDIKLGDSLSQFMDSIGMTSQSGGVNGSITRLKEQMKRLFAARIAVVSDPNSIDWTQMSFTLADKASIWWDPQNPRQAGLFESTITLGEQFFNELMEGPVPIDIRALRALRQSPISLDIYMWLTYRMFSLRKETVVPWEALKMQFGSETSTMVKFRELFRRALVQVQTVYPAKVDPKTSGLVLSPSNTHIPKLNRGYA